MKTTQCDVAIIGAGPAGAVAASLLTQKGWNVVVLEKEHFPRFSIGESLLPQCMSYIEQAGMLDAVNSKADELGFQFKNGAAFYRSGERSQFDFSQKFSDGPATTYQVKRADFDKLLADEAQKIGADMRFGHAVTDIDIQDDGVAISVDTDCEEQYTLNAQFILDASGFGRVLPKMLDLEMPSELFPREAIFCHIRDGIPETANFDRNKILITVHPKVKDMWYWLIPFSDGTSSFGVVARPEFFDNEIDLKDQLKEFASQDDNLSCLLANAEYLDPSRKIGGYSANVKRLYGDRFALLGNAGEFLDPVFSSGVTIAMHSASLAAKTLDVQLSGQEVCWEQDFAQPLKKGIDVFKHFVMSWYDTSLQQVIFFQDEDSEVKPMISSILAGYAWDGENPFVKNTKRGVKLLVRLCEA